jgi:streptogramin lyase
VVNGTLTHSLSETETAVDDSGNLYAMSSDGTLVIYNTTTSTASYVAAPGVSTGEPRVVWDPTTKRVYLAGYESTPFFAFDPTAMTFTPRSPLPGNYLNSDAMCTDRNGHIFASDEDAVNDIWSYDTATDTWSQLPAFPFAESDSEACVASADGWLYYFDANGYFGRLRL